MKKMIHMPKRAIVFDLDGVIIDSCHIQKFALHESYRRVVGDENLPSFEEFFSYAGDSLENIFRKMGLPYEMIGVYREISRSHIDRIKVFEGISDVLSELREKGILLGICTGKDRLRTIEILTYFGLYAFFQSIVCSDDVRYPKPFPDSLLHSLQILDVLPGEAIMVGDAIFDIRCAKSAHVECVSVLWGEGKREAIESEGPDYICETVQDLRKVLREKTVPQLV